MQKQEIFRLISENPVFHLATMDGNQPRVRGMLLFRADEDGIVFHTANTKDVYKQIIENPKVELCFQCGEIQIRITGTLERDEDETLRNEIFSHPTRKFLQSWKANGIDKLMTVFRLNHGTAVTWTMADNFKEKEYIML